MIGILSRNENMITRNQIPGRECSWVGIRKWLLGIKFLGIWYLEKLHFGVWINSVILRDKQLFWKLLKSTFPFLNEWPRNLRFPWGREGSNSHSIWECDSWLTMSSGITFLFLPSQNVKIRKPWHHILVHVSSKRWNHG